MQSKFSVVLIVNGHGFFAYAHQPAQSIGMVTALEIADTIFENSFSQLPASEQIVLKLAFGDKELLFESLSMSVFSLENGEDQKGGAQAMILEVTNRLHEKIITS
jgi:hypothetical protein